MSQRYCDWCLRLDSPVRVFALPSNAITGVGHGVYCSVRCRDAHAESNRQRWLWQQARDANAAVKGESQ